MRTRYDVPSFHTSNPNLIVYPFILFNLWKAETGSIPSPASVKETQDNKAITDSPLAANTNVKAVNQQRYAVGVKVKKIFYVDGIGELYDGHIESYDKDTHTYHILYDDGDEEDLSEAEVDAIVDLYD